MFSTSATIGKLCGLRAIDIGCTDGGTSRDYIRERDLAMVAAFNAGLGPFGVARHFGVTVDSVTELLGGRSDIAPNRRWRRKPGPRETDVIVSLWDRYRSTQYITQRIGLWGDRTVQTLKASGVRLRSPEPPDQPPEEFFAAYSAGIGGFYQLCQCFGVSARWGQRWLRAEQLTRPRNDQYERDDLRTSLMDAGIEPPGYRHIVTNEDTTDTSPVRTGTVTTVVG